MYEWSQIYEGRLTMVIIVIKSGLSNLYFIIIRGIENDVLFLINFKEELEMTWNFTICAENTCMTT